MTSDTRNILLTGATGTMGFEGLMHLIETPSFRLTLLARPSAKNRRKLKKYMRHDRVRIVWGDLLRYEDVLEAMRGIDIVLHLGGMVSPEADKCPELTMKVNIGSTKNIVEAIKAQPHGDRIKLVYIGSVAQLGAREVPECFARSGDRMKPARFDCYAVSKIMAERIVAESGLKYWVSLRQTGILYPGLVRKGLDPITFHIPLNGVLEWVTLEDSGRLLARVCERDLPDDFWRGFYNVSSGDSYRLTNYEFECKLLKALHCPPPEKIFEPKWFATRNFHGCWYSDADILERYLGFRDNTSCDDYFRDVIKENTPWYFRLVKIVPPRLIKMVMRSIAYSKDTGTMHWIKSNDALKIETYFGSCEAWAEIPGWDRFEIASPARETIPDTETRPSRKPACEWEIDDIREYAAAFNGKCLAGSMVKGDTESLLRWENEEGGSFYASPRYVVLGGFFPDNRLLDDMAQGGSGLL